MRTFECPVCGEDVPIGAKACPGCGSDERTGWNEEATRYDGVDLPGEDEGERSTEARGGWKRWMMGLLLIVLLLAWFVF